MSDPFRFRSSHFVTLGRYACLVKGLFALQTETRKRKWRSMSVIVYSLLYPACRATFTLSSWKRGKRKKALPTTSTFFIEDPRTDFIPWELFWQENRQWQQTLRFLVSQLCKRACKKTRTNFETNSPRTKFIRKCKMKWNVTRFAAKQLKGPSRENDIERHFREKSVLISKIWLKIS